MSAHQGEFEQPGVAVTEGPKQPASYEPAPLAPIGLGEIAVVGVDSNLRITQFNHAAELLTGWSGPDAITRPVAQILKGVEQDLMASIKPLLEQGAPSVLGHMWQGEATLVARDDCRLAIAYECMPISRDDGKSAGAVLLIRKIPPRSTSHDDNPPSRREAARRIEGDLRTLTAQFTEGMFYQVIAEAAGRRTFTYLSHSVWQLYGVSAEQVIADASLIYNRIHEDDIQRLKAAELEAIQNLSPFRIEVRVREPSGTIRWSSFVSSPKVTTDGSTVWDGIEFVITERKIGEAKLQESERFYRGLFENMLNGYAYCEMLYDEGKPADFVYLATNQAFETHTHLRDVVGKRVSEVIPGIQKSDPELIEIYGRVAMTGHPERFETYVEALKMWFSISVYSPRRHHFVAVFDVIDERKRSEEALRQSETRLREAQHIANMGHWEHDHPSGEIRWSTELYRILDLDPEHVAPSRAQFFAAVHPEDRERVEDSHRQCLQTHEPYELSYRMRMRDGGIKFVDERGKTNFSDHGKPLRTVGTIQDVTEQRQLDDQRREAQKMEAIGKLAGGVAHDFNNMLSVILNCTELASYRIRQGESCDDELESINKAALSAATLTRQLLALGRRQACQPVSLNLNDIVSAMNPILTRVLGAGIVLTYALASDLRLVYADGGQIEQILMNLVFNARDAMRLGGTLTIGTANMGAVDDVISRSDPVRSVRHVRLSVSDTGIGMDEQTRQRIFEPFFTTKSADQGTGLGLASVYGIVKQNGGSIAVDSELGKGTTMQILLPLMD